RNLPTRSAVVLPSGAPNNPSYAHPPVRGLPRPRPLSLSGGVLVWDFTKKAPDVCRGFAGTQFWSGHLSEREVVHAHPIWDVAHLCCPRPYYSPLLSGRVAILPRATNHDRHSVPCRRQSRDRRAAACGATIGVLGAAGHHRESSGRRRRHCRHEGRGKRKAGRLHAPAQAGKLRALAVADDSRNDLLPGVPTTAESGFPELQGAFWACVAAPAGTPETIVSRLNQLINRVLQSPEIEASLAKCGAKQRPGSPQDLAAFWNRETQKWGKIISAAGIKAD